MSKIQKELAREYAKIATKLNNNPSEEYLDNLLETFTQQLSNISESKQDYHTQKKLLRNLKSVKDNKSDIELTEDQKIIGSLEKIKACYDDDTDMTLEQIERKFEGLEPYLEILENVDLNDYENIEDDFKKFLENLISKKRKNEKNTRYKINNIGPLEMPTLDNRTKAANERLNSYFNSDKKKSKPIQKFSAIVERINEDNTDTWNIDKNLLNTFFLALRNLYLEQSSINRVKSLFNSGATMKEAIETEVKNKATLQNIKSLVRKYQQKGQELQEAQMRLY